jgi:hypothetical protein
MKTTEIKRGEFNAYYAIRNLKVAEVNRDLFIKHAENFKNKLNDFGWMMPIVISSNGDVIEGHHRLETAKLLKQKTIPAYIVDWIDTKNSNEHLDCIINLNNGNRAWLKLDYLKAFAKENEDYKTVYKAYLSNSNNISVGNVINCFFGKTVNNKFKKGECKIQDIDFAMILLNSISELVSKYGTRKIQAYCIRELINVSYVKTNKDLDAVKHLLREYDKMASTNHPALTSISEFKPTIEKELNYYILKKNADNR